MSEFLNDCVRLAMSIGIILVVACCVAPVAWLFRATGRRRRKRGNIEVRRNRGIGTLEAIGLTLIVILLAISLANGTISSAISSLLSK